MYSFTISETNLGMPFPTACLQINHWIYISLMLLKALFIVSQKPRECTENIECILLWTINASPGVI